MSAPIDRFGLRLAAQAAHRVEAANQQWPAFEQRLGELGYPPSAMKRAFAALSGPRSVSEALEELQDRNRSPEPVSLPFELIDERLHAADLANLAAESVTRHDSELQISYHDNVALAAGLDLSSVLRSGPLRGLATDDLGNEYESQGAGHIGVRRVDESPRGVCVYGGFSLPLPVPAATELRIRIGLEQDGPMTRQRPTREFRVALLSQL